ncbi:MAG: TolC family protein [Cyclobacteriaceae bacterium]
MRILLIAILCVFSARIFAQETFTIQDAIDLAIKQNPEIRAAAFQVEAQRQLKKTSTDLPKTDVTLLYGQYNSYTKNDNNISITQSIPFSSFGSQGKLNRSQITASELRKASTENQLIMEVKQTYYQLAYSYSLRKLLLQQDSLFEGFFRAASLRYQAGETKLLEQTTAEVQRNEAKNRLRRNESDIVVLRTQMKSLLNSSATPDIAERELKEISLSTGLDSSIISSNPSLALARQEIEVAASERKVMASKAAPDLLLGFFTQTLTGAADPETGSIANSSERFTGFQVGVALPIWFGPHQGRVRAAEYKKKVAESNYATQRLNLDSQLEQAIQTFQRNKNSLEYYRSSALPNADLILKQSQAGFRGGDIGYTEYLLGVRNVISIREGYLQTLNEFNQSIVYIEFLSGNK